MSSASPWVPRRMTPRYISVVIHSSFTVLAAEGICRPDGIHHRLHIPGIHGPPVSRRAAYRTDRAGLYIAQTACHFTLSPAGWKMPSWRTRRARLIEHVIAAVTWHGHHPVATALPVLPGFLRALAAQLRGCGAHMAQADVHGAVIPARKAGQCPGKRRDVQLVHGAPGPQQGPDLHFGRDFRARYRCAGIPLAGFHDEPVRVIRIGAVAD